jgi:hypothetical protein
MCEIPYDCQCNVLDCIELSSDFFNCLCASKQWYNILKCNDHVTWCASNVLFVIKTYPNGIIRYANRIRICKNQFDNRLLRHYFPNLQYLEFANVIDWTYHEISGYEMQMFLRKSTITTLLLSHHVNISKQCFICMVNSLPKSHITHLGLDCIDLSIEEMHSLFMVLPQTKIQTLRLDWINRPNVNLDVLANNLQFTCINSLDLSNSALNYPKLMDMIRLLPWTQIRSLNLDNNIIGAAGARALSIVLPRTMITHLFISCNDIGSYGLWSLSTILPHTKLVALKLGHNMIGSEVVPNFARCLPETIIRKLDLSGNNLGISGIRSICQYLPQTKITHLDLSDTSIKKGIGCILTALPQSKIVHINLNKNDISFVNSITLHSMARNVRIGLDWPPESLELKPNSYGLIRNLVIGFFILILVCWRVSTYF